MSVEHFLCFSHKQELASGKITKEEYIKWKINWPQTADDCGKFKPKKQWRKEQ